MKLQAIKNVLEMKIGHIWKKLAYFSADVVSFQLIKSGNIVVLIDDAPKHGKGNVLCLFSNGKLKWQIQEQPHHPSATAFPYTSFKHEKSRLIVSTTNGFDYEVDQETGTLLKTVDFWKM